MPPIWAVLHTMNTEAKRGKGESCPHAMQSNEE